MTLLSLSPRQTRTALDLLTAGVVISVAFAMAGLTWRLAGHAGTGAIMAPSGKSAPGGVPNIAPVLALAPFGKAIVSEAGQPTALPLALLGLVSSDEPSLSTAFISVSGETAAPFHIGDTVGGAKIEGITRDRVILSNGGNTEYLGFPDPNAPPVSDGGIGVPGAPPAGAPGTVPPAPKAAPNLLDGPRGAPPPGAGASTAAILQRFNATPVDGGYRIGSASVPGLQAGDVLMSVNGTPLSDPTAAGAAFTAAQGSGSATVQVLRDGKRMTLTVPLK